MRDPANERNWFVPAKIVSGGQTGVDRAGLEAAIALGLAHGGWCPAGRMSEDGSIPSRYELTETDSRDYRVRTEMNVVDSDATVILYERTMRGGTLLTQRLCRRHQKPLLTLCLDREPPEKLTAWLTELRPETLNVAGPRESSSPSIEQRALEFLLVALTQQPDSAADRGAN